MNKLFPIVLALMFFSCDNPSESVVGCENGAEYSESGYYCDDWEFIEDLFNCSGDECTAYLLLGEFSASPGMPNVEFVNGRLVVADFSHMGLTSIPESIGNLTYLQELYLSNNQITSIPESICNLSDNCYIVIELNYLCEEYNFSCIDDWGGQNLSNCCEGPNGEPNWTECVE
tara:strand:- start:100 stop:618 length:519 start_codon:yes stop_codon:yes gene_type:complete